MKKDRNFGKKNRIKEWVYSKTSVIILCIVVLFLIKATHNVFVAKRESTRNMEVSERKVLELQARADELKKELERIKTESGVEEEIRKKFGVAKEGETVVMVLGEKDDSTTSVNASAQGSFFGSLWGKITGVFR
jgi:cell division protein FtsB